MNSNTKCKDDSCDGAHCPQCGGHKLDFYVPGLCQSCLDEALSAPTTWRGRDSSEFETALKAASAEARKNKVAMVVVHAPLELAEGDSPFGYCPEQAATILFRYALKGIGQPDNPAQGIVARIKASGAVSA